MQFYYADESLYPQLFELVSILLKKNVFIDLASPLPTDPRLGQPGSEPQLICAKPDLDLPVSLSLQDDGLWIYSRQFKPFNLKLFYADFITRRQSGLSREMLLQAINLKATANEPILALDLTAGLGRDSILMSLWGYRVTMLENNPALAVILNYLCHEFKRFLPQLTIVYINSQDYLPEARVADFDIIYLDPMFEDNKQALAKKDMQLIDLLIKHNPLSPALINDYHSVFKVCQQHCRKKIVVKRDNKQAPLLATPKATYTKSGKTIRFDVYQC